MLRFIAGQCLAAGMDDCLSLLLNYNLNNVIMFLYNAAFHPGGGSAWPLAWTTTSPLLNYNLYNLYNVIICCCISSRGRQCLAAGMDDYLSKPIDRARLLSTLRTWMPRFRADPAAPPPR
jgi:hypothetical protein